MKGEVHTQLTIFERIRYGNTTNNLVLLLKNVVSFVFDAMWQARDDFFSAHLAIVHPKIKVANLVKLLWANPLLNEATLSTYSIWFLLYCQDLIREVWKQEKENKRWNKQFSTYYQWKYRQRHNQFDHIKISASYL